MVPSHCLSSTYPDSVSLVKPPNTTIPKTLNALPKSQNATDFDDVSGKARLAPCRAIEAAAGPMLFEAMVLCNLAKGLNLLAWTILDGRLGADCRTKELKSSRLEAG